MRVLYIGCLALNHFERMASWFASRGHDVHVLTFGSYLPAVRPRGLKVHLFPPTDKRIPLPQSTKWVYLPYVRRLVSSIGPDVVHGHFLTEFGAYASFSGAKARSITLTGSDGYFNWRTSAALWVVNGLALQAASRVFVPSEDLGSLLRRVFLVKRSRVSVLPDGVQEVLIESYPPSRWQKDDNLIVSTRRLSKTYDVTTLVEAAARVIRRFPKSRFVVAGDGPERSSLTRRASELGLGTRLEFCGWLEHPEVARLLSTSSIYVSTSRSDGSSVSLLEAMALGAFPVVSDIAANRAWIHLGENGLLFEPGNAKQLADAIVESLGNRQRLREVALTNRSMVEQHARFATSMEVLERYYLANARQGGGLGP